MIFQLKNLKRLTIENFHHFLNKIITIIAEDRGTSNIFVPASIATSYAWNSAPIDGKDIRQSIPAIGRH